MANKNEYNYEDLGFGNNLMRTSGKENLLAPTFSEGVFESGNINKTIEKKSEEVEKSTEKTIKGSEFTDMWINSWIKSRNYSPKTKGFYIDGATGFIECMKLYVGTGGIVGGKLDIPDTTTTKSFHVDTTGNIWSGATTYNITTNPFAVSNAGVLRATLGYIGGFTINAISLYGGIIKTALTVGAGTTGVIMDSILGDVPVIIRRNKKWIDIIPIMELHKKDSIIYKDGFKNIEVLSANGWTGIKHSYRHKVKKQGYDIILGGGRTKVTEDHSLVKNNKKIKPNELKIGDTLDIFKPDIYNFVDFPKELAWVMGLFVAEGSLVKRKNHFEASIANFDSKLLDKSEEIIKNFFCLPVYRGKTKIDFYGQATELFKQCYSICSHTTRDKNNKRIVKEIKIKKIPIQILNGNDETKKAFLDGYLAGDGHICDNGQATMDSKELSIIAGLQYIYLSLGKKTSTVSRNDKLNITTLNTLKGFHPVNKTTRKIPDNQIKKIRQFKIDDFVYDLETESHTFVAGIGYIVHHNTAGLRGYDSVLGNTFNLPTNGSAPTFSSGIINETVFEISTNAVLRTSATVGDGSANSAGILVNNAGIYACQASQALAAANIRLLIDGSGYFSGAITGSTINIPNATTPLFSVDSSGNVKVKSLERDDFHWLTMFESLDSFASLRAVLSHADVTITTLATIDDAGYILKQPTNPPVSLSWSKNRSIRTRVSFDDITSQTIHIVTGSRSAQHIGFRVNNDILYATVNDGSTYGSAVLYELMTISAVAAYGLRVEFISGTSVKFYVNDSLMETVTTGLPTGVNTATIPIEIFIRTNEAIEKSIRFSYWDFWQAN